VALSPFQRKVIVVATLLVVIRVLFPVRGDCSIKDGVLDCDSISYVPGIYYVQQLFPRDYEGVPGIVLWRRGTLSLGPFLGSSDNELVGYVQFSWGKGIFLWRHTLAHAVAILLIAGMLFVVFPNGLSFTRPKD